MVDPKSATKSPKRPFIAVSSNPRRVQPSDSTSLPRSKKLKIDHDADTPSHDEQVDAGQTLQDSNLSPPLPQEKSQESSSDQSASKWFNQVNENVEQGRTRPVKPGEESPFYLARQSTYKPATGLRSTHAESFGQRNQADDEENHDLRDVIDDLTVENRKLKRLIRGLHSRNSSPLSSRADRVLEVRMHGLPAEKKRELEQLLKTFTLGLDTNEQSQAASSPAFDTLGLPSRQASSKSQGLRNGASVVDSGYASISTSGANSSSQFVGSTPRESTTDTKTAKEIKNYLHDIPSSLLPQESSTIDENAKMALVVQRLEQLFTGKLAAPGEHSLPVQQQKISHSAARADRRENVKNNRVTKAEGAREAHMMPPDMKHNFDIIENDPSNQPSAVASKSYEGSPEQRPTRPLDLDIHRAQVVEDNIRYINHLGLSSPALETTEKKDQPWMYLNLLVSLAQLHTLNVTPALIRKSLKHYSTNFELSKDGHKIRWIGGGEPSFVPPVHDHVASILQLHPEDSTDDSGHRSRRSATSTLNEQTSISMSESRPGQSNMSKGQNSTSASTSTNMKTGAQVSTSQSSPFDYKPIVYQGKRKFLNTSYLDSSSTGSVSPESGEVVQALTRSSLTSKDDSRDGLVTFFNSPHFCADLSGDNVPTNLRPERYVSDDHVIGMSRIKPEFSDTTRDVHASYFTRSARHVEPDWGVHCPKIEMPLDTIVEAGAEETQPLEFDASGIGGVRPDDNFALDVKVVRFKTSSIPTSHSRAIAASSRFGLTKQSPKFGYRVLKCHKLDLRPSKLPPPSYVFFTSSSDTSVTWQGLDDDSEQSTSASDESPAPANFLWQWSSSSTNDQEVGDYEASEASSSLGVLEAARARVDGSSALGRQDGEYLINQAGRTVSGSLAATVGASWSAASVADQEEDGREMNPSVSEMQTN